MRNLKNFYSVLFSCYSVLKFNVFFVGVKDYVVCNLPLNGLELGGYTYERA